MKAFILSIVLLISISVSAQNNFQTDLSKALKAWEKGKDSSKQNFEQLVNHYPKEWLAKYYLALSEVVKTFNNTDKTKNVVILNDASKTINELEQQYPKNVEVLNLKALYLTAKVVQDPSTKGLFYYPEIVSIYNEALEINPQNPRLVLGLAEFNINASKYNGSDIAQDCESVKKSLVLFSHEKPKKNEPKWGKDRAKNLLNNQCK